MGHPSSERLFLAHGQRAEGGLARNLYHGSDLFAALCAVWSFEGPAEHTSFSSLALVYVRLFGEQTWQEQGDKAGMTNLDGD